MRLNRKSISLKSALNWGQRGTARVAIARSMRFENLSHSYGHVQALANINLTLHRGQIVCLLGHSGSGKTTLLRIAAGVEKASQGRFLIDEEEYCSPSRFVPPERRSIGLMYQDYALFPHMTVLKNVMFGIKGLTKNLVRNEAYLALERVGLGDYAQFYPHQLSGGEQQRVALARAIAPRPGILLMDEPFSGLDQNLRYSVREETLAVLREMRATCLMVTHDPEEAMGVADYIVLLRKGRIVQTGTAEALYNTPENLTTANFFSRINYLQGQASGQGIETLFGMLPNFKNDKGNVEVCIRYQDMQFLPVDIYEQKPEYAKLGRVISRRFLGEVELIEVTVEGLEQPLKARVRNAEGLEPGIEVWASFQPDKVFVFEKDAV